ncbi:MAG: spore coat protein [Paenibacillaceae bacterium]
MLNEKINAINHFSIYLHNCQNPTLRSMIERHQQLAIQGYDQLVHYTHDYNAANQNRQPLGMSNFQQGQISYGLNNPQEMAPQMSGPLPDHMIALAVLSLHKNSAKNHMAASLECADWNVRQMLIEGALNCAHQAYETFLFMNQNGFYQVPTMHDHTAKTYLHSYQPNQSNQQYQSAPLM